MISHPRFQYPEPGNRGHASQIPKSDAVDIDILSSMELFSSCLMKTKDDRTTHTTRDPSWHKQRQREDEDADGANCILGSYIHVVVLSARTGAE
ncbi:hypothetical protein FOPE_07136 [Fonsecaea pedrosoi]|nr:hypothetical protein FOPE_07136 [Fonsecaea pedrosoi]